MSYVIHTKVVKLEHRERHYNVRKVGEQVVSEIEPLGWFVLFEGSHECLYLGHIKPTDLAQGQAVKITITPT